MRIWFSGEPGAVGERACACMHNSTQEDPTPGVSVDAFYNVQFILRVHLSG